MYRFILFYLFLFFIFFCDKFISKSAYFLRIKELEFNRISDPDDWNKIRNSSNFPSLKYTFVNSIGKTHQNNLIPILKEILSSSSDDSLKSECIFALGQMGSKGAEEILLHLPFNQLSLKNKRLLIAALSHCATQKTIQFYQQYINSQDLKSDILINAAICSRKNLDVSELKYSVIDSISLRNPSMALSYFLYYTGNEGNLAELIKIAQNSNGLIHKYALKKLNKLMSNNQNLFYKSINNDSTSFDLYKRLMHQSLKRTAPWEIKYYAIPLASILKDSLLTNRIVSLIQSQNNHVSLTALEYLAQADKEIAISTLMEQFGKEQNPYKKGQIIKILAKYYPYKAYSFVMQNLDKGNSKFKAQLLDALAMIKSKMALRTLKQFLYVDDPILICSAFDNLKSLNLLTNSELSDLLASDYFPCVASTIEYFTEKKLNIDNDLLFKLYRKFNYISQFEVQTQIINYIKNNLSLPIIPIDSLMEYASHDVLRRRIVESFPESFSNSRENLMLSFEHDNSLLPDSIVYYTENPNIEIDTERGKIQIELYSNIAPYTVNNFLKLIKKNYFNGLTFHRVIPDFVLQGGDPLGSGWGGPNYFIPSEDNSLPFNAGSVGMATSGFDTGSSQFFICHSEQLHLNGNYTLFGQVIDGMDVVYSILPEDKIITVKLLE
jgi:cyclophilin family peptidyl-prolyl cis-trans isomerase